MDDYRTEMYEADGEIEILRLVEIEGWNRMESQTIVRNKILWIRACLKRPTEHKTNIWHLIHWMVTKKQVAKGCEQRSREKWKRV